MRTNPRVGYDPPSEALVDPYVDGERATDAAMDYRYDQDEGGWVKIERGD